MSRIDDLIEAANAVIFSYMFEPNTQETRNMVYDDISKKMYSCCPDIWDDNYLDLFNPVIPGVNLIISEDPLVCKMIK